MFKNVKKLVVLGLAAVLLVTVGIVAYAASTSTTTADLRLTLTASRLSNTDAAITAQVTTLTGTSNSIRVRIGNNSTWSTAGGGSAPMRTNSSATQNSFTNGASFSGTGQRIPMGQSNWDTRAGHVANATLRWR
ncbi:MAG: hypothetical protein FWE07_01205 [Turicibacter sp.]|nr:hypothetical protein [Turicibacter sp.]